MSVHDLAERRSREEPAYTVLVRENEGTIESWPIFDPFVTTKIHIGGDSFFGRLRTAWRVLRGVHYTVIVDGARARVGEPPVEAF